MPEPARMTIGSPRRYGWFFRAWAPVWPQLLVIAALIAPYVVLLLQGSKVSREQAMVNRWLLLGCWLGLLCLVVALLPRFYRTGRLRRWFPDADLIVEATFDPRAAQGLSARVDSVDDVGALTVSIDGLRFEGDFVDLWVPVDQIRGVTPLRRTVRYLWLAASKSYRVDFVEPIEQRKSVALRIRDGATLLALRRQGERLAEKMKGCGQTSA